MARPCAIGLACKKPSAQVNGIHHSACCALPKLIDQAIDLRNARRQRPGEPDFAAVLDHDGREVVDVDPVDQVAVILDVDPDEGGVRMALGQRPEGVLELPAASTPGRAQAGHQHWGGAAEPVANRLFIGWLWSKDRHMKSGLVRLRRHETDIITVWIDPRAARIAGDGAGGCFEPAQYNAHRTTAADASILCAFAVIEAFSTIP